jgi:leucyl/phenylalanyl-tRNA--protein transferase
MTAIPLLAPTPVAFPDPRNALDEPDGLVAAGGDLSVAWLLEAYSRGLFPWFDSDDEHILWWSPSTRAVMRPGTMRVPRSLAKRIRNAGFNLTMDEAFTTVVSNCRKPRGEETGTWITQRMQDAYASLHLEGYAHSVEVWQEGELCGGLYGVSLGRIFCGESMFAIAKDASKVAFHALQLQLAKWDFSLIDCQIMNPHLASLGVSDIPRSQFLTVLQDNAVWPTRRGLWRFDQT